MQSTINASTSVVMDAFTNESHKKKSFKDIDHDKISAGYQKSGLVWSCSSHQDVSSPEYSCTKEVLCARGYKVYYNLVSCLLPQVLLQQDDRSSVWWKIIDAFLLRKFVWVNIRLIHEARQHENLKVERPCRCFYKIVYVQHGCCSKQI